MSHIFTNQTLLCDSMKMESEMECMVCCKSGIHNITHFGPMCQNCKTILDDEDWRGSICKMRREYLKMNRPQFSKLVDLKPSTIKRYEWSECPKSYFEKTKNIILNYETTR